MSDIFISYAREDLDKVRPLAKALENHGWSVWWDPKIRSGVRFDRLIEKELEKARSILVVWSKASVNSDWVRDEATEGLERNILVSVAIENDIRLPLRFQYIHTEPLNDWDGIKASPAFDKIVRDLEAILGSPEPADKRIEHPDLDAMVEVPAGEFLYQDGKSTIEKPYDIDIYPVTNQQYEKFIKAGGYQNEDLWSREGQAWLIAEKATEPGYWHDGKWNQPEHPVVGISSFEAEAFAKWAGKKLPTEKEWERAARGTDGRTYPWGNEFDPEKCNTKESRIGKTTRVTRYHNGISAVGCYDMVGNVWEWTSNWIDKQKTMRKLRGGYWGSDRVSVRCDGRYQAYPGRRGDTIGFRCARTKK